MIYVVIGMTGEYSDRTEWMVRAYTNKEAAQAVVVEYTKKAKELEVRCRLPKDNPLYFNRYSADLLRQQHPDPQFQMDYTGTEYYYEEVELVSHE